MKAWKHFCTINHHKHLVMKGCFAVGLYKQGLLHDLSKYTPTEFLVGCKYYQGTMSPNNAERKDKGYSSAWLHHKGRNKHHMEYWIDYGVPDEGGDKGLCGIKFTVILRGGSAHPTLRSAVRTRSLASLTSDARKPTISKTGIPSLTSASTQTGTLWIPRIVAVATLLYNLFSFSL